jgi:excisionase family DNA binding protein
MSETKHEDFTASSLAKAAGVHYTYIARLCRQGRIPARKFGPVWLIHYEDGVAWLEARQVKQETQES